MTFGCLPCLIKARKRLCVLQLIAWMKQFVRVKDVKFYPEPEHLWQWFLVLWTVSYSQNPAWHHGGGSNKSTVWKNMFGESFLHHHLKSNDLPKTGKIIPGTGWHDCKDVIPSIPSITELPVLISRVSFSAGVYSLVVALPECQQSLSALLLLNIIHFHLSESKLTIFKCKCSLWM